MSVYHHCHHHHKLSSCLIPCLRIETFTFCCTSLMQPDIRYVLRKQAQDLVFNLLPNVLTKSIFILLYRYVIPSSYLKSSSCLWCRSLLIIVPRKQISIIYTFLTGFFFNNQHSFHITAYRYYSIEFCKVFFWHLYSNVYKVSIYRQF
jgi:hypothetical protein